METRMRKEAMIVVNVNSLNPFRWILCVEIEFKYTTDKHTYIHEHTQQTQTHVCQLSSTLFLLPLDLKFVWLDCNSNLLLFSRFHFFPFTPRSLDCVPRPSPQTTLRKAHNHCPRSISLSENAPWYLLLDSIITASCLRNTLHAFPKHQKLLLTYSSPSSNIHKIEAGNNSRTQHYQNGEAHD